MFNKKGEVDKVTLDVVELILWVVIALVLAFSLYGYLNSDYYGGYAAEDNALMLGVVEIAPGDVSVEQNFRGLVYDVEFGKDKNYFLMFSSQTDFWSWVMHNERYDLGPFKYNDRSNLLFEKKNEEVSIR